MTIGIDIDDTLTNTKDIQKIYWLKYYNSYPKEGYSSSIPSNINSFGDDYIQKFWDIYREELTFTPTFKDNCSSIIKKLNKDGHTLCVITSRPDEKYNDLLGQTKKWFKENNIDIDIIYTNIRDKASFLVEKNIDMLIDDDINHINKALSLGKKAILFNRNNNFKGLQTTNWLDLYDKIKSTL